MFSALFLEGGHAGGFSSGTGVHTRQEWLQRHHDVQLIVTHLGRVLYETEVAQQAREQADRRQAQAGDRQSASVSHLAHNVPGGGTHRQGSRT